MNKPSRKTSIPSANRWRYMLNFQHVPETAKVCMEDVAQLQCRTTHCVCLQQQEYNENDGCLQFMATESGRVQSL